MRPPSPRRSTSRSPTSRRPPSASPGSSSIRRCCRRRPPARWLTAATGVRPAGDRLVFQAEHLQTTGSFKARGMTNRIATLPADARRAWRDHAVGRERRAGLCLGRAGGRCAGHGRDARWARSAPRSRPARATARGSSSTARTSARRSPRWSGIRDAEGLTFVHPFDDPAVIAGNGTAGLELVDDVSRTSMSSSSGSVAAGSSAASRRRSRVGGPAARVIGVEPVGSEAMSPGARAGRGRHRPADERRRRPGRPVRRALDAGHGPAPRRRARAHRRPDDPGRCPVRASSGSSRSSSRPAPPPWRRSSRRGPDPRRRAGRGRPVRRERRGDPARRAPRGGRHAARRRRVTDRSDDAGQPGEPPAERRIGSEPLGRRRCRSRRRSSRRPRPAARAASCREPRDRRRTPRPAGRRRRRDRAAARPDARPARRAPSTCCCASGAGDAAGVVLHRRDRPRHGRSGRPGDAVPRARAASCSTPAVRRHRSDRRRPTAAVYAILVTIAFVGLLVAIIEARNLGIAVLGGTDRRSPAQHVARR